MTSSEDLDLDEATAARTDRIAELSLDTKSIVRWSPEVEHERAVAVFDLLEENRFEVDGLDGPYRLVLSLRDHNLVFAITSTSNEEQSEVVLSTRGLRGLIKDYFLICESYFQAIRGATPSRIEAIDMARRAIHDDGSRMLGETLEGRIKVDHDTARRLFTLVCVLHVRS